MIRPSAWFMLVAIAILTTRVCAGEPKLDPLFPAGGGRGQAVPLTLSGTFPHWPVRVWASEPGVTFEPGAEKGKLVARIAPDAVPGLRLIRVYDDEGASASRPFVVGTLPEVRREGTQ